VVWSWGCNDRFWIVKASIGGGTSAWCETPSSRGKRFLPFLLCSVVPAGEGGAAARKMFRMLAAGLCCPVAAGAVMLGTGAGGWQLRRRPYSGSPYIRATQAACVCAGAVEAVVPISCEFGEFFKGLERVRGMIQLI